VRSKKNTIQARSFAEMLEDTIRRYHNKTIDKAEIIDKLIELEKVMKEASQRG
ncbi:MAG: type restriction enzyme subunit, partial [Candidatus Poribacteria bacterium]|nr:type restriction enzyme subunit [Candidatus Poribacteria bacterium]